MTAPVSRDAFLHLGRAFSLSGTFVSAEAYGDGHIHDTFVATYRHQTGRKRYLHQRLNTRVFPDPRAVMENVARVCDHLGPQGKPGRGSLTLRRSLAGNPWWIDDAGAFWRTYDFIEGSVSWNVVTSPLHAREAARAFGSFQASLADLRTDLFYETIPDFHHTPKRLERLRLAAESDVAGRARNARAALDFAFSREPLSRALCDLELSGELPLRIIHNDTKLNNVLFREGTAEAICVVDLDTVMPGLSLYDFGDLVRSATNAALEDERDLKRVFARADVFEALVEGFCTGAASLLNDTEKAHLLTAGKVMTYECGIRFLTDYLLGDTYFKTSRDDHNLDRCRTQFQLLRSLDEQSDALQRVVDRSR